jgi:hypothetical protein
MNVLAEIIEWLYPDLALHAPLFGIVTFLNESRVPTEIVDDLCRKTSDENIVIENLDLFPINDLNAEPPCKSKGPPRTTFPACDSCIFTTHRHLTSV